MRIGRDRIFWLGLLLAGLLLLPGCFDGGLDLVLKPSGAGSLTVNLTMPQSLAVGLDPNRLAEIMAPRFQISRRETQGMLELTQRTEFSHLDALRARRVRFEIKRINLGFLGMRDDTFRLTGWLRSTEGDRPDRDVPLGTELDQRHQGRPRPGADDPAARRARRLLAASTAGYFLTVVYQVPGRVKRAWPLEVGTERFEPKLGPTEGLVTWRVPLGSLVNAQVRHTLVFRVDFQGSYRFKAENITEAASNFYEGPGRP